MSPAAPPPRRLSFGTRMAFGYGSIAYGVKDNGFATFLLLFYNQVIGLSGVMVGAVIAAVLVVEAFADPLIGYLSDHTRGPWGPRHPWMYASALPIALGWLMLWNPPHGWSHGALLGYLFVAALLVRLALSAFEIPASALGPELSSDYDERTRLFSYRYLFAWGGGLVTLALAYLVFLVPDATHPVGLTNPNGYAHMALFGATVMAVSILASSLVLHREVRHLPPRASTGESLGEHWRGFRTTIANRAFLTLMAAGVCAYTAQGVSFALANYMYGFVWQFKGLDYQWLSLALLLGAVGAFIAAPHFARMSEKRGAAAAFALGSTALITAPYFLRLVGAFPLPGNPAMLPLLLAIFGLNTLCSVASFILGASMLSDVVEESQARTGRRSEGVFFAGSFFVQKLVGGMGTLIAGTILAIAQFPANARAETLDAATLSRLMLVFALTLLVFYGLSALAYARFPFGRAEHEARLARTGDSAHERD